MKYMKMGKKGNDLLNHFNFQFLLQNQKRKMCNEKNCVEIVLAVDFLLNENKSTQLQLQSTERQNKLACLSNDASLTRARAHTCVRWQRIEFKKFFCRFSSIPIYMILIYFIFVFF